MPSNDKIWAGEFGSAYTERNRQTVAHLEKQMVNWVGMTRTALNRVFLGHLHRNIKILEVGCNIGMQMQILLNAGFRNVWGIDVNGSAVRSSMLPKRIRKASGQKIPFKKATFDIVMTSGVLIHLPDGALGNVMSEMYRATRGLIFCREYYAMERVSSEYFGRDDLLWHDDFAKRFQVLLPDLVLEKEWRYRHAKGDAIDAVFLLRKVDYKMPLLPPPRPKKKRKRKRRA